MFLKEKLKKKKKPKEIKYQKNRTPKLSLFNVSF